MFEPTYVKDLNQQYTGVCVRTDTMKHTTDMIIKFFLKHSRYKHLAYEDLYQMISPSVRLNQYKIFEHEGKIIGFVNWAFVNQTVLDRFLTQGLIGTQDWNSGMKQLYNEVVATQDVDKVISWMKNYSLNLLGPNVRCYWIRSQGENIKIRKIRTKESWRWAE